MPVVALRPIFSVSFLYDVVALRHFLPYLCLYNITQLYHKQVFFRKSIIFLPYIYILLNECLITHTPSNYLCQRACSTTCSCIYLSKTFSPSSREPAIFPFKLRLPKSLHKSLADQAKCEGISMNQYCLYLLSQNHMSHKLHV